MTVVEGSSPSDGVKQFDQLWNAGRIPGMERSLLSK